MRVKCTLLQAERDLTGHALWSLDLYGVGRATRFDFDTAFVIKVLVLNNTVSSFNAYSAAGYWIGFYTGYFIGLELFSSIYFSIFIIFKYFFGIIIFFFENVLKTKKIVCTFSNGSPNNKTYYLILTRY